MPRIRIVQPRTCTSVRNGPSAAAPWSWCSPRRARAADAVIIAGDLFDRAADAVGERAAVRKMVEELAPPR
jgi:hypothetical protein